MCPILITLYLSRIILLVPEIVYIVAKITLHYTAYYVPIPFRLDLYRSSLSVLILVVQVGNIIRKSTVHYSTVPGIKYRQIELGLVHFLPRLYCKDITANMVLKLPAAL